MMDKPYPKDKQRIQVTTTEDDRPVLMLKDAEKLGPRRYSQMISRANSYIKMADPLRRPASY
jgi:hypothetical protein